MTEFEKGYQDVDTQILKWILEHGIDDAYRKVVKHKMELQTGGGLEYLEGVNQRLKEYFAGRTGSFDVNIRWHAKTEKP